MNKFRFLVLLFVFLCFPVTAQVTKATVSANGVAPTRDGAIASALVNAAGQAFGMQIDSQTVMNSSSVKEKSAVKSSDGKEESSVAANSVTSLNEYISQKVKTPTNSPILGYTVNKVVELPTKLWDASITMTYSKFQQIDGDSTRRSVVVVTNDAKNRDLLISTVSEAIVASRRFDVLNRNNEAAFNQEKGFILGGDAAQGEVARLGQASGADYLVLAEVQSLSVSNNQRETIALTGEVLVRSSASGILKLQAMEFSTRKVKWSASEKFNGNFGGASSVSNESLIKMIASAADKLVEKMVVSIYPIQIVKVVPGGMAVINRGEGSVNKGESYAIFLMGEELKDPQSGESLGAMEIEAGIGKITDVKPKFSFLKLDSGTLEPQAEYIVRKVDPKQLKPAAGQASGAKASTSAGDKRIDAMKKAFD
jgi:hypothetical protein